MEINEIDKEIKELGLAVFQARQKSRAIKTAMERQGKEATEVADFVDKKLGGVLDREDFLEKGFTVKIMS